MLDLELMKHINAEGRLMSAELNNNNNNNANESNDNDDTDNEGNAIPTENFNLPNLRFSVENSQRMSDELQQEIELAVRALEADEYESRRLEQEAQSIRDLRRTLMIEISRRVRKLPNSHLAASVGHENLIEADVPRCSIGAMTHICCFCRAKHFIGEMPSDNKMSLCCDKGRVVLEPFEPYPELLHTYCTNYYSRNNNNCEAQLFNKHILYINNSVAFGSVGANISLNTRGTVDRNRRLPAVVHINGIIQHTISHLSIADVVSGGQYYCLSTSAATERRLDDLCKEQTRQGLGREETIGDDKRAVGKFLAKIDRLLRSINLLTTAYKML